MWRRIYLLLVLVRLYFALSPSYLHPDENFQGPEVIAGTASANYPISQVLTSPSRRSLLLPRLSHLGVHGRLPCPQHLSAMAHLRPPNGHTALDMARYWNRGAAARRVLDASNPHVHAELRARGLGYTRADTVTSSTKGGHTAGRVFIRDLDVPDAYLFQLY
jgi:hypothetical protein